ncbi:uncharacterized protein LOC111032995 [Myzus persicae]|uniref:uncharacterized protein LOC111032995 n=1 Tax=Myzus persicae TaxID=13164 RepID=UPI000B9379A7|nr:uncharacterized protein LOC111032995 [Myzus persicae]XP_022169211.1 uncharacterized protein LOC111032995 [Myzus persicae]XP_022169213.1 uncharacterized protein LOC111032995 [Myzus persicae]
MTAATIYAAFVLQQHELESNGVLTHQIMKFTESEDPAHAPYAKLENVSMDTLAEAIQNRISDSVYKFLNRRSGDRDRDGVMLYAIPTVEIDDEDLDQFNFVSSHEGTKRVLFEVLDELGCEYTLLSPDMDIALVDSMATWTLTVSESNEYHELRLTPGHRCADDLTLQTSTAELQINNVRLSEILYLAEYTNTISPNLVRHSDVPLYLGSKRICERFKFPKTTKTSAQILREIQRNIDRTHIPLTELWNIVMGGVKFLI